MLRLFVPIALCFVHCKLVRVWSSCPFFGHLGLLLWGGETDSVDVGWGTLFLFAQRVEKGIANATGRC